MALTIATDNFRGRHHVLMRAAKTKHVSFLRGGKKDTCVVFDIRPSPRAICTKAWRREDAKRVRNTTHVSLFATYDGEQITAPSVLATPLWWKQRSNRWRKTKKITSTAAVRWNA